MPRTTQCQSCGIILNLPANTPAGKRLKCPKCGHRFALSVADASSESTLGGPADADLMSRFDMETKPTGRDDLPLSLGDQDLRETFDLPLMSGRDAERAGTAPDPAIGDAASLLDNPTPKRKMTAAEARSRARRCSNCGGLVPLGMSTCISCGLDQESGLRVGMDDDLIPPPPPRPQGPPLHVAIMGGLCGTAGLILLILSLVRSGGGAQGWQNYGWLCLALVSAFAILASVQFIRGKSAKLLMVALTLGVVVDVMGLVAMPLLQATLEDPQQVVKPVTPEDPDLSDIAIKPFEERIELRSITLGVGFLVLYAILSVYLMSAPVKKYVHSQLDRSAW
jgi:hypothetical protein